VGFKINKPYLVELQDDKKMAFIEAIKQNITPKSQFVVCILPNSAKDRYDALVKRIPEHGRKSFTEILEILRECYVEGT